MKSRQAVPDSGVPGQRRSVWDTPAGSAGAVVGSADPDQPDTRHTADLRMPTRFPVSGLRDGGTGGEIGQCAGPHHGPGEFTSQTADPRDSRHRTGSR